MGHGLCADVKFLTNIKTAKSQFVLTAATEHCVNVSIHVSVSMFQDVCTHESSGLWRGMPLGRKKRRRKNQGKSSPKVQTKQSNKVAATKPSW